MKNSRLYSDFIFIRLTKWSVLTLIIVGIVSGLSAYYFANEYGLTLAESAITIIGIVAAFTFLKVSFLIITYPFFNKLAFEGSLFIMALVTALLLVVAVGSASILAAPRTGSFPTAELIWLLPLIYAITTIFLFFTFYLSHRMFKH